MILNLKCCDNYNEIYIPMDTKSSMGLLILELWASVGVQNLNGVNGFLYMGTCTSSVFVNIFIYTQQKVCLLDIKDLSKFLFVNRKQQQMFTCKKQSKQW